MHSRHAIYTRLTFPSQLLGDEYGLAVYAVVISSFLLGLSGFEFMRFSMAKKFEESKFKLYSQEDIDNHILRIKRERMNVPSDSKDKIM